MASLKKIGIAMLFAGSLQASLIVSGSVGQDPLYEAGPTIGYYDLTLDDGYTISGNPFFFALPSTECSVSAPSCSFSVASFRADLNYAGAEISGAMEACCTLRASRLRIWSPAMPVAGTHSLFPSRQPEA